MSLLLTQWKLILIAVLVASNALTLKLWDNARTDLIEYRAEIASMAQQVADENARLARIQLQNLSHLRTDYEAKTADIRADAVAAYLRRVPKPAAGSNAVSATSAGSRMDDGASPECRLDTALIQDAADDALKLAAWQEYARLNQVPVVD